ncbi:MAG: tetratricopeptide repeat protein, partial [Acidobacteriota bacterium]|nr:tetratricopeptide repeat protein [Acidobacteriota bacterium]
IDGGALASLSSLVDAIPSPVVEEHPRVLTHRAEVARLRGEYDEAQAMFRHAAALLHEAGDGEGQADALHSLATIARRRGDFEAAFSYLDRAVELTDESSPVRVKCGNTRGLCLVATGEWTRAEAEFRAALESAEERKDDRFARLIAHNLGLPALIRGNFGEALRWLRRMLRDDQKSPPMPQEATAHLNIARCHLYRGETEACEQHLNSALEYCQLFNLVALHGEVFETYGNLHRERGDTARASEFYERAARAYDEAGIDLTRRELMEEQAVLYQQAGDLMTAHVLLDRLVAARSAAKDEMGFYTATLTRASMALAQGDSQTARAELESALKYFRANGLYYYEAQSSMSLAACCLALGDEIAMLEHLRRALELAARFDYEYWLHKEAARRAELFAHPDASELLPADIQEQLAAMPSREVETAPLFVRNVVIDLIRWTPRSRQRNHRLKVGFTPFQVAV